jgi:hypothetical protein
MVRTSKTEALARMAERLSTRPLLGFVHVAPTEAERRAGARKTVTKKGGISKEGRIRTGQAGIPAPR